MSLSPFLHCHHPYSSHAGPVDKATFSGELNSEILLGNESLPFLWAEMRALGHRASFDTFTPHSDTLIGK